MKCGVVIDTNVLISALRSKRGASYRLLMGIGQGHFDINISVPLALEYEKSAKKIIDEIKLSSEDIDDVLDYICSIARPWKIFYLWRPFLKDPKDDMVLELAVASKSDFIVTYNKKDFEGAGHFGVKVVTANEFLKKIGGLQ
ncbi:MAG: putative toxin-antitoxin system toxin component, PIN family [Nitrospirae bacterium]|nr:MAG: putative toxin-antitoxin system toxin component, PIN family [Nitrospirota bacterium]